MLRDIQDEIVELLQADPYFADITAIMTQRKGLITAVIAEALGTFTGPTKIGLAIVVIMPVAKISHPNVKGPEFDQITPVVRVLENVLLNMDPTTGIGKPCEDVAEYVAATLHGRPLDSTGRILYCPDGILLGDDPDYLSHDIPLRTEGGIAYTPAQVATPAINFAGGNITSITCGTAGAVIYATVNGNRPVPTTPPLALPQAAATGIVVKARAYKAGSRASEIATAVAP